MEKPNSQIVIYKDKNGNIKIDVRFDGDTVWLTQDAIAALYDKGRSTVTEHIQNVFQEGELEEKVVCREFRRTTVHGAIKGKTQETTVKYYKISHELMKEIAEKKFDEYKQVEARQDVDFDEVALKVIEGAKSRRISSKNRKLIADI